MANKAAKTLAARNAARLTQTHLITLALHISFLLLRTLVFRASFTKKSAALYALLCGPGLAIEFWLEKVARPTYSAPTGASTSAAGELRGAGEDLDGKGLMEYLWDVVYWTWACLLFASVFGDRMWWFYVVIPLYTVWSAYTTYTGARSGMAGMAGGDESSGAATGQSKRSQKMEKRGGQKVQYR